MRSLPHIETLWIEPLASSRVVSVRLWLDSFLPPTR